MTRLRKTLLAGIAAIGIGAAGAASAQNVDVIHVMNVAIPGGVAQIRYIGDVPPQIAIVPAPSAFDAWMPAASVFGPDAPFAMMDRIAAEMDRRTAAMFRYAEAMADRAAAGGGSYSFVSTLSGNGVCTQSVRIISRGDGTPPQVERHSSGNCGAAAPGRPAIQRTAPVPPAPAQQPDLILTRNSSPSPYTGMIRQVASVR